MALVALLSFYIFTKYDNVVAFSVSFHTCMYSFTILSLANGFNLVLMELSSSRSLLS
nr:MAG TPA: hypothetical protein [Caudoviricetes sp.]